MKKTFTLLAALFFTTLLFAFPDPARLSVTGTGNVQIRVMIDGIKYRTNDNAVMVNNLQPGNHAVKIYQLRSNRGGNSQYNNQRMVYQLIYSNNVYVKPQYHVDITINRFGKTFVDEQIITGRYNEEDDDDWGDNDAVTGKDNYSTNAMSSETFDEFKQTIRKESYENTRLSIAKQAMTANYFTSVQIKQLLELFSYENTKLELAKYAYQYTVDKGNYFIVTSAFSYSNSKEELMEYIKNFK